MVRTSGISPVCLVYHVYLALPDETDQIDETDRTDQMNRTGWRTFSASCYPNQARQTASLSPHYL